MNYNVNMSGIGASREADTHAMPSGTSVIAPTDLTGPLPVVDAVAGGSAEDEIQRLKLRRLQAESKIAKARQAMVSAELDIRVIDHCIKALSPLNNDDDTKTERGRSPINPAR